ncbi:leucine-rich repeat domain-containing protein [Acetobacterium woodii]|uniref:Putative cell surface protein n=1 Tax=Acetobacterium woodii (strain ATCC 29683 / DSM 1030 / JCM 2381 / KCTC 1655 / WB1) TaxID=931626 RepID=H6LJB6_ACEWD|nr:leucine-rich repeat domain-containing protein [Acetobacterium woodii]AFA48679.1 putative cell surface protein [Acetobacterium woodii DSM 1030]
MEINNVTIRNISQKRYLLKNRYLPSAGDLDWPLFLTVVRVVKPKIKTDQELTEMTLLKRYSPAAAILVDEAGTIRYIYGETRFYLETKQSYSGVSVNNVLKLARNRLRRDLNISLHKAITKQVVVSSSDLSLKMNDQTMIVKLTILPLLKKNLIGQSDDLYLIVFEKKNNQINQQSMIAEEAFKQKEVTLELTAKTNELHSREMELAKINKDLDDAKIDFETVKSELETSRIKLRSVKENIFESETEHKKINENIKLSNQELQILTDKLTESRNELEKIKPIQEKSNQELTPIGHELKTIKSELLIANQELNERKEELEKLNQDFTKPTQDLNPTDYLKLTDDEVDFSTFGVDNYGSVILDEEQNFEKETTPLNQNLMPSTETKLANNVLVFKDALDFQEAASHGFRHDNDIISVRIPEGVEILKRSMFYKCSQLEEVIFPESLKHIEDFAFYGCEKLISAKLNQCFVLETIGTSAFEGCRSLKELVIPDSVVEIEEASFLGCQGLITVNFPGNSQLEIIGSHVFKDCVRLEKIALPDHLKHIGISCFYNCHNLTEILLPKELETVGEYAFWGCDSLIKISVINKKIQKQPGFNIGFPEGINL